MRGNCLDEGILQSYMDGELSPEMSAEAATHLAACSECAAALSAAEAENAFFAKAFAPDAAIAVPTERLRASLEAAVAERNVPQRSPRGGTIWSFGAIAAWLSAPFNIAPRHAAAFASLLAFVAFAVIFGVVTMRRSDNGIVADKGRGESAPPSVINESAPPAEVKQTQTQDDVVAPTISGRASSELEPKKNDRNIKRNRNEGAPKLPSSVKEDAAPLVAQQHVPGEEEYLRSIASLAKMIEVSGDAVLPPKFRAEYERNLAVIDKAIENTRQAALRNPKDADATAFLFSSYQNKIELLSTVADQAQVATLGR